MSNRQAPALLVWLWTVLRDPKMLSLLVTLFAGGGAAGTLMADAGVTAAQVDSTVATKLAPVKEKQNRMDTAMMRIYFRQDVQMTEDEKRRADSLMRAALKNINYGGSP